MLRLATAVLAIALLTLGAGGAMADTLSISVGSASYITGQINGRSCGRLLIKPTIPEQVQRSRIDFALLEFPTIRLPDSFPMVTIDARRVTTDWEAGNVSWTHPWRNAGGDFDTAGITQFTILGGDSVQVRVDVTKCVQAWQAGSRFGLLLKRPGYEGGGYRDEAAHLRQAIRTARLKLYFTPIQE